MQVEEYREDGLYLEGIVKTEDLHCFEGYLVSQPKKIKSPNKHKNPPGSGFLCIEGWESI